MAGTPRETRAKNKAGPSDSEAATSGPKRMKRSDALLTSEEVANFLPKPAVEYVKESKVSTYFSPSTAQPLLKHIITGS
jgi:hypothetical protein